MTEGVQQHLQDEIDQLIRENTTIKERNMKLKAIEREFTNQSAKKPPART